MDNKSQKLLLFEYFVFLLEQWRGEKGLYNQVGFTKLRLQKLLFFVCTIRATHEKHILLDVFNEFYALPYGPVEMDIYESMTNNRFSDISFSGNNCVSNLNNRKWNSLSEQLKNEMEISLSVLKNRDKDYLSMPIFELVEISHRWSAWQISMEYAHLIRRNKGRITTEDILNSSKFY